MKKTVIIEVLLLFVLPVLIAEFVLSVINCVSQFNAYSSEIWISIRDEVYQWAIQQLLRSIFTFLACVANISAMIFIALRDFKAFQPLIEKHNLRKQERAAARVAKGAAKKQKRIEELQRELDDLHGSDKSD